MTATASNRDELLYLRGQAECNHPSCNLHDFLPIKCPGCHLAFCTTHHSPFSSRTSRTGHACSSPPPDRTPIPCPICTFPVGTPPGGDPNATMDRHIGGDVCRERKREMDEGEGKDEKVREAERLRARKERGEVCWTRGCRKNVVGGLGVKCESCSHRFCMTHRSLASHSCSSTPNTTRSSTPQPQPKPQPAGIRQVLGGPSREAALAAISRNSSKPSPVSSASSSKPAPKLQPQPKPLTSAQKDRDPNERKTAIKPLRNPLSAQSRHTKAELASRRKALEQRAKLGLLSEEEKLIYAEEVGKEESRRRQSDDGGGGGGKKGGDCVVM